MTYNMDFLIAAMVILLLILWYFWGQKRAENLNNQVFFFWTVLGIMDVTAELISTYYITSERGKFGIMALLTTTVFYLLQALLPYTWICYIQTLHEKKLSQPKRCCCRVCRHFV